jgi:hypothetical protein
MSETGGEPRIVLPLRCFRVIAGLEASQPDPQIAIGLPDLGDDERRVLEVIAARLRMGAGAYGALDVVANDARDWRREASEELLDGFVYLAREVMRRRTG